MIERQATLEDFRQNGARHGANIARGMVEAMTAGRRDPRALMHHHIEQIMPAMRAQLSHIGASDLEVAEYVAASIATTERMMGEIAERIS
jgi:hypothetical protein